MGIGSDDEYGKFLSIISNFLVIFIKLVGLIRKMMDAWGDAKQKG